MFISVKENIDTSQNQTKVGLKDDYQRGYPVRRVLRQNQTKVGLKDLQLEADTGESFKSELD